MSDLQKEYQEEIEKAVSDAHTNANRCPKCLMVFSNARGLRMHTLRKHSDKAWDATKNFRTPRTKEERLAHRKEYQKQLRERYYREGKNSRGQKMPEGWKPRKAKPRNGHRDRFGRLYSSSTREYKLKKQREYQKALYHRKKLEQEQMQNGAVPALALPKQDIAADAAKAILLAAKVLRGTIAALKLP